MSLSLTTHIEPWAWAHNPPLPPKKERRDLEFLFLASSFLFDFLKIPPPPSFPPPPGPLSYDARVHFNPLSSSISFNDRKYTLQGNNVQIDINMFESWRDKWQKIDRKLTNFCHFGQVSVNSDMLCQFSVTLDNFLSIFLSFITSWYEHVPINLGIVSL